MNSSDPGTVTLYDKPMQSHCDTQLNTFLITTYYLLSTRPPAPQSTRSDPLCPACHSGLLAMQGPRPASDANGKCRAMTTPSYPRPLSTVACVATCQPRPASCSQGAHFHHSFTHSQTVVILIAVLIYFMFSLLAVLFQLLFDQ